MKDPVFVTDGPLNIPSMKGYASLYTGTVTIEKAEGGDNYFTFIIDGLQAVLVGLLVREFKPANVVIGSLVAGVWKVFGYFIAGGILSGFGPALGEIIGNSFQMVVGLIVGFALFSAVRKAYPPLVRLGNLSVKAGE